MQNEKRGCPSLLSATAGDYGMVVSAKKCGSAFKHEVWGGQLDGKRGKAGFRHGTASLVDACPMTSDDSSACGCTHFPSGAQRRLVLTCICGCRMFFATTSLCRRSALPDELLVSTFLAPLLDADLRAQPHPQLFATDAALRAPVHFRRLCLRNSGPVSTIFRMRKVVQ